MNNKVTVDSVVYVTDEVGNYTAIFENVRKYKYPAFLHNYEEYGSDLFEDITNEITQEDKEKVLDPQRISGSEVFAQDTEGQEERVEKDRWSRTAYFLGAMSLQLAICIIILLIWTVK